MLKRWMEDGVWKRILQALLDTNEANFQWMSLDSSLVKAKKGAKKSVKRGAGKPPSVA